MYVENRKSYGRAGEKCAKPKQNQNQNAGYSKDIKIPKRPKKKNNNMTSRSMQFSQAKQTHKIR